MRRTDRNPAQRMRFAVEALPRRTRIAMLHGIHNNDIIAGGYADKELGGICPMLAAHRNGGRTNQASFARAWDRFTGACRPRLATARELRHRPRWAWLIPTRRYDVFAERMAAAEEQRSERRAADLSVRLRPPGPREGSLPSG